MIKIRVFIVCTGDEFALDLLPSNIASPTHGTKQQLKHTTNLQSLTNTHNNKS